MEIGILDLDYFHFKISPNPNCMKISSFHKQKGDGVKLISSKFDLKTDFNLIYITKNDPDTPGPPVKLLNDPRSRIFGEEMFPFNTWQIPHYISACRPDYILYPEKDTREQRSELLQFADESGRLLMRRQEITNAYTKKNTLVIDKNFWNFSKENILKCLNELKDYKNVAFFEPIWLKIIISNEEIKQKFFEINFIPGTKFKFKNDLGDSFEDAQQIAAFLLELKARNPRINVGMINFAAITLNHFVDGNASRDLERCLKICNLGKKEKIEFRIQEIENMTPYNPIFQTFVSWTHKNYHASYMEHIVSDLTRRRHCGVADIYSDRATWSDEQFIGVLHALQQKPEWIKDYCLREWGEHFLPISKIDWEEINKKIR